MLLLFLVTHLYAQVPASVPHNTVDSVVVERLVASSPRRIPMQKRRAVGGPLLEPLARRLRDQGFFRLAGSADFLACDDTRSTVSRLVIRVRDNGIWRAVSIPDSCQPTPDELAQQMTSLRETAWNVLAGRYSK